MLSARRFCLSSSSSIARTSYFHSASSTVCRSPFSACLGYTSSSSPSAFSTFHVTARRGYFSAVRRRLNAAYPCEAIARARQHATYHCARNFWQRSKAWWSERPTLGAALIGTSLWALGDSLAQHHEGHGTNYRRFFTTAAFGGAIAGGLGYHWYLFLEDLVAHRMAVTAGARTVAAKLALELAIWHPFTLAAFWFWLGIMSDGKSLAVIKDEFIAEFPKTFTFEVALWTPIDVLNFWIVPPKLQVVAVNAASVIESTVLADIHSAAKHAKSSSAGGGGAVGQVVSFH